MPSFEAKAVEAALRGDEMCVVCHQFFTFWMLGHPNPEQRWKKRCRGCAYKLAEEEFKRTRPRISAEQFVRYLETGST
jgi:hypothetical protein